MVIENDRVLGISVPFVMYAIFRILIVKEEQFLENKFGQEYLQYKKEVNGVLPTLTKFLKMFY